MIEALQCGHSQYIALLVHIFIVFFCSFFSFIILNTSVFLAGCIETTLTMQQTREQSEAVRLTWRAEKEEKEKEMEMEKEMEEKTKEGVVEDCDSPLLLDSLDLRTFVFDVVM